MLSYLAALWFGLEFIIYIQPIIVFKTIMIISHIDTIKDIVDKNLEIILKGKDSHVRFE